MADIRPVTDSFAVAPQIDLRDLETVAAQGFTLVINNRPDGEQFGQPTSDEVEAAARALGLDYRYIPVRGGPGPAEVQAVLETVSETDGPVLAFCRSGTRSIVTWALGQLAAGASRDDLIELGRGAGYELSGILP